MPTYDASQREELSYIRFFHAAANIPLVDVYVDSNKIVEQIDIGQFSNYIPTMPGNYIVDIYTSYGMKIIEAEIEIPPSSVFTIAVVGTPDYLSVQMVPEMFVNSFPVEETDDAYVRVVHFSQKHCRLIFGLMIQPTFSETFSINSVRYIKG